MYSAAIVAAREDGTQSSLRMLRNVTVTFWTTFPLIWLAVQVRCWPCWPCCRSAGAGLARERCLRGVQGCCSA